MDTENAILTSANKITGALFDTWYRAKISELPR